MSDSLIYVWDRFIRLFHWSLALLFTLMYLSATYEFDDIHFFLAYLLTVLLASRIVWGIISTGYGRFSSFIYPPAETLGYLKTMLGGKGRRYLGHNPAGALMIFTTLLLLAVMIATGFVMLTWGEYEGPLWAMGIDFGDATAHLCRQLHETSTDLLLILIALHLAGVAHASFEHRENLVKAMWNGLKRGDDEA